MSISIEKAEEYIKLLREIKNNPELILTKNLFDEGSDSLNFLYNIEIDGKHILDFCIEQLKKIAVLKDCVLEVNYNEISICMPDLMENEILRKNLKGNIIFKRIMMINLEKKIYLIENEFKEDYIETMNRKYTEPEKFKLPEFLEMFQNFNLKNRIKYFFQSSTQKRQASWVIFGCHQSLLFIPQKKVEEELKARIREAEESIEFQLEKYKQDIEFQNYLRENFDEYMKRIDKKQQEICLFLDKIFYKNGMNIPHWIDCFYETHYN